MFLIQLLNGIRWRRLTRKWEAPHTNIHARHHLRPGRARSRAAVEVYRIPGAPGEGIGVSEVYDGIGHTRRPRTTLAWKKINYPFQFNLFHSNRQREIFTNVDIESGVHVRYKLEKKIHEKALYFNIKCISSAI